MGLIELDVGEDELDVGVAVIGVDLGLVGDVEEFVIEQLFLQFSHPESYTSDGGEAVGDRKLQVVSGCSYSPGRAGEANASCGEERLWIALAEGSEHLQLADHLPVEFAERCLGVDFKSGRDVGFVEIRSCVYLEIGGEALYSLRPDSQAGGHFVASEGVEMLGTGLDCAEQAEAGNGPGRALSNAVLRGGVDHDRWSIELVHYS